MIGAPMILVRRRRLMVIATTLLLFCRVSAQNVARTQIPSGPYRIAGAVVNAKSGAALARVRVVIANSKSRQSMLSVIAGDDGRFEFHVPAGKYDLSGAKRGFITGHYQQHEQFWTGIVTGAELDTENLTLRLSPNAVLTGKVLDEFQEPVRDAQIMVYREDHTQGVSRVVHFRSAMTNDEGRYEITPLIEGTYFVSAKGTPWYAVHPTSNGDGVVTSTSQVDSSLDVAYPTTYYGDSTEAEDAAPIPVRGGDRLEADIHLNPAPALHIIFHAPEDGTHGITFPSLQKPSFDGAEQFENAAIQNVGPGTYEMTGVAAGRYRVRTPDSSGQLQESTDVNLNGNGELDVSSGRPTSKIKAAIQIEGAASLPSPLWISMRTSKGSIETSQVDAKGEANWPDVAPGKYDVVVFSQTRAYSVVRIASEAGIVSGHALTVPAGASLAISLSLVTGSVTVEGFAKLAGKAASGAMVILVPKDPEANHDRFRRDQSDLDGSFSLKDVIPGSYTVIAIDDGWDLDWSQAGVLAQYLKRGQAIETGDRSQSAVRLPDAVDVQSK
jgi:hypothetical protein